MDSFFWDGRESRLDAAVNQPFINSNEMGRSSMDAVVEQLQNDEGYRSAFREAFPAERVITERQVGQALAAFVRTVGGRPNRYDLHREGHKQSLSAVELAGLDVFQGRGGCAECHQLIGDPAKLADGQFHHLGVEDTDFTKGIHKTLASKLPPSGSTIVGDSDIAGLGRFVVTRSPSDLGAFRTPSLRNVAMTAPYMHDGSVPTLEAAVDHEVYYRSLSKGQPIALTADERQSLLAFLRALSSLDASRQAAAHGRDGLASDRKPDQSSSIELAVQAPSSAGRGGIANDTSARP